MSTIHVTVTAVVTADVTADVTSAITVTATVATALTGVARVRDAGEKEPFLHAAPRGVAVFQGIT